jgi:hypothetical protein
MQQTASFAEIRLQVIKITSLFRHDVRHGGKRLLLRCTRNPEVPIAPAAGRPHRDRNETGAGVPR